jgi:hypothetical protein
VGVGVRGLANLMDLAETVGLILGTKEGTLLTAVLLHLMMMDTKYADCNCTVDEFFPFPTPIARLGVE